MGQALSQMSPAQQRKAPATEVAPQKNQPPAQQSQGVMGTLGNWWNKGTEWAGEKYDQASQAVSGAYQSAKKSVTDLAEVVQSSDLSMKDGKISASTDMDEVMDVLPASMREKLALDKSLPSANRASLEMDTKSGRLTLRVPDLMLSSLAMGGVTAGKTRATGVVLTIDNAGALAHDYTAKKAGGWAADKLFGAQKATDGKIDTQTSLKIGKVLANDVGYTQGGLSAKQLELSDLSVGIQNQGGGLPAVDASPDMLRMDFSVGSAVVRGFSSPKAQGAELGLNGLSGNLDQAKESGDISAKSMYSQGLSVGGERLGSGRITDLNTHIDNKGGGLPFLDKKADHLQTTGAIASVSVDQAQGTQGKLGHADAQKLAWSQGQNGISGSVGSANLTGVDTTNVDAGSVSLKNASASKTQAGVSATVGALSAKKVDAGDNHLASVEAAGLSGSSKNGTLAGSVENATLTGVDTANVDAASVALKNASASKTQEGVSASVGTLSAKKVDAGDNHLASLEAAGLAGSSKNGTIAGSVENATLTGVDTANVDAASVALKNASASKTQEGVSATVGALSAKKVDAGDNHLASLEAAGVSGNSTNGNLAGSVKDATLTGVDTANVDAASVALKNASASKTKDGVSASVGTLSAKKVDAGDNHVASVEAAGIAGSSKNGTLAGSVNNASITGLDTSHLDAQQAAVAGLQLKMGQGQTDTQLAQLSASGVQSQTGQTSLGIDQLNAKNIKTHHNSQAGPTHDNKMVAPSLGQMAGLVDNADLRAHIPLTAGEQGPVTIPANTSADVDAHVRNGAIDAKTTRARTSQELDGPLWVGVKGAYLDPNKDGKSAKLRADLAGWKDINLSDKLPGGQDSLPLNLQDLSQQVAPSQASVAPKTPNAPAQSTFNAEQMSASGIHLQSKSPQSSSPAKPSVADLSKTTLSGNIGLRSGKADLGSVKADLLKEDSKDNTVNVQAKGADNLALQFTRLLVGNLSVDMGGTDVSTGKAAMQNAEVGMRNDGGSKQIQGNIGSVTVENLGIKQR